jgi:tetratricopeptide (TPR) repeat protein
MVRNEGQGPLPGSIADTIARLAVWGRRAPRGLARVEFVSEFARQRVVDGLRDALSQEAVPVHEIGLPREQPAVEIVRFVMARLRTLDKGMVSITGFATAFPDDVPLVDSLRMLNANRENLALYPLCQVWWMTSAFVDAFLRAAPDLDSWFMVRLQLTEVIEPPPGGKGLLDPRAVDKSPVNIDDARRRAASLAERFQRAVEAGASAQEQADLALAALESLVEAGAVDEARSLSDRWRSAIGRLVHESEPDHPDTARLLDHLATFYEICGEYTEAEPLFRRALAIREKTFGPDHRGTAASLNNLALLYMDRGRYAEAEPLYRRALAIHERVSGAGHPDTATSLNNLAGLYANQGRYAEAEPLYRRALAISERASGAGHPDTATSLNNLAGLFASQGRYAEAEPLYRRALAIRERVFGAEHPLVAASLNNLAMLYINQGRHSEAESTLRHALTMAERALGSDHPNTTLIRENFTTLRQAAASGS